jgi:hypothetical protein
MFLISSCHTLIIAKEVMQVGQGTRSAFHLSSRPRRNWSASGLNIRDKYEKTALLDGSISSVPFGNNWYSCLTQGVNLTFRSGNPVWVFTC